MSEPARIEPDARQPLANTLLHFLAEPAEAGRTELRRASSEVLERVYTPALRIGIKAHALAARRHNAHNPVAASHKES